MVKIGPALRHAIFEYRAGGGRQYVLAQRLDEHPSFISHIVHGSVPIRADDPRVLRLAAILGVPAEEAFAHIDSELIQR